MHSIRVDKIGVFVAFLHQSVMVIDAVLLFSHTCLHRIVPYCVHNGKYTNKRVIYLPAFARVWTEQANFDFHQFEKMQNQSETTMNFTRKRKVFIASAKNLGCICLRDRTNLICINCHRSIFGRVHKICPEHPSVSNFLLYAFQIFVIRFSFIFYFWTLWLKYFTIIQMTFSGSIQTIVFFYFIWESLKWYISSITLFLVGLSVWYGCLSMRWPFNRENERNKAITFSNITLTNSGHIHLPVWR